MFIKKKLLVIIICISFIISIAGEEIELAKFYLKKSFYYYQDKKKNLSNDYLSKAYEYSKEFPEYYYISNLLLPDNKSNMALKESNAENILKKIDNSFFIDNYELLKHAALIFENVRNFDKSIEVFNKFLLTSNRILREDYVNYIEMLFNTNNIAKLNLIPNVIKNANKLYDSLDFNYYSILYEIITKKIKETEFNKNINVLISNNYSQTKVLYLKILFFNNSKNLSMLYNEYIKMKKYNIIEAGVKKRLIFNLLKKAYWLSQAQILVLLEDWNHIGQQDQQTNILLINKKVLGIIKNNKALNESYLKYTGVRRRDEDEDGNWEEYFEYKDGIAIKKINDKNQDDIYETEVHFFDNGYIREYLRFKFPN